jgi:hypothetical protein
MTGGCLASQRVSDADGVQPAAYRSILSMEHDGAHGMKGNGQSLHVQAIPGRLRRDLATKENATIASRVAWR